MAFGRRKKENEEHKGDLLVADGIYLKQATMKNGHIVLNCFLRALIVFFLVFGSIGGFLSAFDIDYNYIMVIAVFLILSMYFSFLYASSKFIYRDFGYVIFFALFVGAIYLLRIYANSGFYAIINNVLDHAKTFFDLPGVREYEVQIDNDFFTISIVTCFIGMVMIIVLNIWMYSIMSMFWTVLFTFPILFIPIYMKLAPDPLYIIFLSIGYLAVAIFKANGHYVVFAWDAPFKTRGFTRKRVTYTQDSGIFRQIIGSLAVLSMCMVFVVSSLIDSNQFERYFKSNELWNTTSESIGNFILLGFSSLYNQYPNTGGMSGGKLGGVANVRPDYMTDLEITFVPYGNEAIYLKGYTGGIYGENEWISVYEDAQNDKECQAVFEEESLKTETEKIEALYGEYSGLGRMVIHNVGADSSYLYYPYYTYFRDYSIYNKYYMIPSALGIPVGQEADYNFYPKIVWEEELGNVKPLDIDISKVNADFLDVPDKNKEVIDDICGDIGLNESMTENEIVEAVTDYFADNYPYTLKPGQTPRDEDFINYFLTKNKKGYCAHFASSAVLIFRNMGIPARYIEGYAVSMETVFASDSVDDENPEDYYTGYSAIGDAPVMKVEVPDAQAHAWVEIYVDGFGWKNVEVTPGSNEATEEDDFWSAFSGILQDGLGSSDNQGMRNAMSKLNMRRYAWIIYVMIGIIAAFIIFRMMIIIIRKIKRYMRCHSKDRRAAVIARYSDICDMIRICDDGFDGCRSHEEQLRYMIDKYGAEFDVEVVKTELERISFHDEYPDDTQYNTICEIIASVRRRITKTSGFKNRIRLMRH